MSTPLAERLHQDMIAAMKTKQKERLGVLRMLVAAAKEAELAKRATLSDAETLAVLMSYAKKREEAILAARQADRNDLAQQEQAELAIVQEYLPKPLSDGELSALVDDVVRELSAASMKDMGRVMKRCLERAAGRADGARIGPLVKAKLAG